MAIRRTGGYNLIALIAFIAGATSWITLNCFSDKVFTRWRCTVRWKWISGTLFAVSLGRMIYLFAVSTALYQLIELFVFIYLAIAWGITLEQCFSDEERLCEVNAEMLKKIAGKCCCGGEIECCQSVELADEEEKLVYHYQIYCPKCKEQTEWCESIEEACAQWLLKECAAENAKV